jgi:tight adherence protein B
LTAQGRISGSIIGALPVGLGAMLMVINPTYMSVLFTDPIGIGLLIGAGLMELTGFMLIKKIVTIKY